MQLTEAQCQVVQAANGKPVEVLDPQTRQAYVLIAAEVYQRIRHLVEGAEDQAQRPEAPGTAGEGQPMRLKVRELPMLPEVAERVKEYCKKLGFWRRRYVQEVEDEMRLQYHFGGQYVGLLPSPEGPLIVAAGDLRSEAFDRQLAALPVDERRQVLLLPVDRWDDTMSLILSPLPTHEG